MGENSFEATLRLTAFPVNSIRLVQAGVPPFVCSVAMVVSSPEKVMASLELVWEHLTKRWFGGFVSLLSPSIRHDGSFFLGVRD